jgi:hypothetical protein
LFTQANGFMRYRVNPRLAKNLPTVPGLVHRTRLTHRVTPGVVGTDAGRMRALAVRPVSVIASTLGVSRATLYRTLAEKETNR